MLPQTVFLVVFFSGGLVDACTGDVAAGAVPTGYSQVNYQPSLEHLENPGRGFSTQLSSKASKLSPLKVSTLDRYRTNDGITHVWRQWKLDTFVDRSISSSYLQSIRNDLEVIKTAGWTAVIRFMYTDVQKSKAPYGDATKSRILQHIQQLKPIFADYEGVIDVVQAGFIGTWGEWYYTTHFGDPNHLDWRYVRGLSPKNWQDRREVLSALLAAVPKTIQVQVRYLHAKQEIWKDKNPTTKSEVLKQTDKARTSHHNDCFLSNAKDKGTYIDKAKEYPYMVKDTKYAVMGGETCRPDDPKSKRHRCPTAKKELSELHWSYLNQAYDRSILDLWVKDGCYEEIHRRLGYRLVLTKAILPSQVKRNAKLSFQIYMENIGYAAPFKKRDVALVLRSSGGKLYSADLSSIDVRDWLPGGSITINSAVYVPSSVPAGNYQVLLAIKDKILHKLSDYNILLANRWVPEYKSGYNKLRHSIKVLTETAGETKNCSSLKSITAPKPSKYERRYCKMGKCDGEEPKCFPFSIPNPSFETKDGWQKHGGGFTYTTETASHGKQSIKIANGGAKQMFMFPAGTRRFIVKADSKNSGVQGSSGIWYSIYCDVKMSDNSWAYGVTSKFVVGRNTWHTKTLDYTAPKAIKEAWCYAMFQKYSSGTAYFDNFQVQHCNI